MTGSWQELRRGWPVLLGSAVGMAAGIGLFSGASGFFIKPLSEEFGWSRGQISLTGAAVFLTSLLMPVMGRLVDKHGPRPFLLFGAIVFAFVYAGLALMPGQYWIYLVLLALVGIAAGPATAPLIYMRPLVGTFSTARGLALALGLSGSVGLSIILLPLLQHVISTYGWRWGYAMLAPIALCLALTAYILLGASERAGALQAKPEETSDQSGHTLKEALADSRFWLLALAMACSNIAGGAFHSQMQPLLSDMGVPGATAALLAAWYGGSVVVGRLACGFALDRFWAPGVACISLGGPVLGLLIFLAPAPEIALLMFGCALVGLSQGAEGDLLAYFTARYFGLKAFGAIFGVLGLLFGVSVAIGAVAGGFMFDAFGNYHLMLIIGSVVAAGGAVAILLSGLVRGKTSAPLPPEDVELEALKTSQTV